MSPTRPGPLLAITVIAAVVAWLVVRQTFATLAPLPWSAVPAMLLLAVGEAVAGHNLRARMTGRRAGKPLEPIAIARMAALAKASSAAAAVLGGLAAGFFIYVAGLLDKVVPRHDAFAAGATMAAAVALLAGALYLERCCRSPDPPEDQDQSPGDRQADWR
jgi:fucose 4-O-acetylase-like acetyltransferase